MDGLSIRQHRQFWRSDAMLWETSGALLVTVKQHTQSRATECRSSLDLSVDGGDGVDSVGGWLRVNGSLSAGQAPTECVGILFFADGTLPAHIERKGSASFQA